MGNRSNAEKIANTESDATMLPSRRAVLIWTAAGALSGKTVYGSGPSIPVLGRRGDSSDVDAAYLSNGLIGIRPGRIPIQTAPACVAGFVGIHPTFRVESLSPAPYPFTTDIRVNGNSLLEHPERARLTTQELNMANGELVTELAYNLGDGVGVSLRVRQVALRSVPSLLLQVISLQLSKAARVEITPEIGTAGVPGTILTEDPPRGSVAVDRLLLLQSQGGISRLGAAVSMIGDSAFAKDQQHHTYSANVLGKKTYTFYTLASMLSSFYHDEPDLEAVRLVNWGLQLGTESLEESNTREWKELWKSRVLVDNRDDQKALDAAFFYLQSSNHRSNLNGMAPYGLSSSRYYLGHSFWDTETWSFLPLLLSSPLVAESLLRFRLRGLDAARKAADLFGYRGAQFPWEAAPLNGEEVTPTFAATGWAEQHIVLDVALAFWQYQMAAGDTEFLHTATWPVLRAVAEWIESRGVQTARGFEILNIMGPDETSNGLNNSAYVNLASRMVLKAACRCADKIGVEVPVSWRRIIALLYLPINGQGGLSVAEGSSNNAFADISFLFPFDVQVDAAVLERTWQSFKSVRSRHEEIGFAKAAEAGFAAAMGDRERAARLFREAWEPAWLEPFGMAREVPTQNYGCFLTDMGALLQTAMIGFTGLRVTETAWNKYPAALPANWSSIEIGRIYVHGQPRRVLARHGKKAELVDV
jgi:trehalose/maltose hydrolase-like predicted phosphorylase